jgi:hypothetical protein
MSYLMLADGTDPQEFYITIPTGDGKVMHVREDYFDQFPDDQYEYIMDHLDGTIGVGRPFDKARERKKERRNERKDNKSAKAGQKGQKKTDRQGRRTNFLDKVLGTVGSFAGKNAPSDAGGADAGASGGAPKDDAPFYENPVVWIGGIALLGIGAYALYSHSQKQKQ